LRHLKGFVAVAEECHFGRAAKRLHIAQPPLSQQIRKLEADLGVQLLIRSTRSVRLSPAGERYLLRARDILASVEYARAEAGLVADGRLGRVGIGFTGSATYELLPTLARALRTDLPGLVLELKGEMLTPTQVEVLKERRLDMAFLRPPFSSHDLRVQVLRREELIAVLPESHLLAAAPEVCLYDLRDDTFISYPSDQQSVVYEAVFGACQASGFSPRDVQEVAETSALVAFVAAGLGVALVPASVKHLQITGAVFKPLTEPTRRVELAMVTRKDDDSPQLARVMAVVNRVMENKADVPSATQARF
jgi:DNA-binding transcriptional LysR family regulator